MSKVTLSELANLDNPTSAVNQINANNDAIEQAFGNTLSLDGTSPNTLNTNIDFDGHDLNNVGTVYATAVKIGGLAVTPGGSGGGGGGPQVNADWTASSGPAQILHKPALATVATTGSYNDLINKPNSTSQVNADWNASSGVAQVLNKPTLATVATTGSYTDLASKPTIPAAQVQTDWNAPTGIGVLLNKPTLAASATTDTTNAANISSGTLPAARLPNPSSSTLGGVQSGAGTTGQFMTGINTSGVPQFATPSGGGGSLTAPVTIPAGTASVAPLVMTAGTNLTTPAAGVLEYDGKAFYGSPVAGVRGVVPVHQYSIVTGSGGVSLNNDTNTQSYLPSGARNFPVQAGVIYRFRAELVLNTGTNNKTISALFAAAGGAAFSWISYTSKGYGSSSRDNMNFDWVAAKSIATMGAIISYNGFAWMELHMEGAFVMSSGGTIQPQIQFSMAPGGTNISVQGTCFELYSCGAQAASAGLT